MRDLIDHLNELVSEGKITKAEMFKQLQDAKRSIYAKPNARCIK